MEDIFNWYNLSKYRNVIYGFSAIWLILFHITNYFVEPISKFHPLISTLLKAGNAGVDIFLIMSGICLYFSLKKTDGKHILYFYKRRFSKLLKLYLLICIPWLIIWTLFKGQNFEFFFNLATIFGKKGGQFWFFHFIAICYLIYPIIYKLIEKNKSRLIVIFIPIYFILLCTLNLTCKEFYATYEIAFTRLIPFLIGALLGKKVYEKKPIKQKTILLVFLLFILHDLLFIFLQKKQLTAINTTLNRLYLSIFAMGTIFLINTFFEIFKLPKTQRFLSWAGKVSLETYVVHLILIKITADIIGIDVKTFPQFVLYALFLIITSLLISNLIQKILNHLPPKSSKHPASSPSSPPL